MDSLLNSIDPKPVTILNGQSTSRFVFLAHHAGRAIPQSLHNLGLNNEILQTHAAYDIGTDVAVDHLASLSGATTIIGNYSRLVIDLNRSLDNGFLIPDHAVDVPIKANMDLSALAINQRVQEIYVPYQEAVQAQLKRIAASGKIPIVVDLHSFTKHFHSIERPWDIGFLWE